MVTEPLRSKVSLHWTPSGAVPCTASPPELGELLRSPASRELRTLSLQPAERAGGYLEGFDEGPQQGPDALSAAQQLDQAHDPEEAEEGDGDAGVLLCVLESIGNRRW